MSLVGSLGPSQGGAQRLPKPRLQRGAAFKALRRLFADKEDTAQVFEIMRALNGGSSAWGYQRLLETPEGGRLAYERVELEARLMDDAWLWSAPFEVIHPLCWSADRNGWSQGWPGSVTSPKRSSPSCARLKC